MSTERRKLKNIQRLIDFEINNLPTEEMFISDLRSTIEKLDQQNGRTPSKYYKPSSMKCIRNMYFQRVGQPPESSAADSTLVGICESGSARHNTIQSYLTRMKDVGIDCSYVDVEQYVKDNNLTHLEIVTKSGFETKLLHKDLNISFLCDGIIKYHDEFYIFEFKTETTNKFWKRTGIEEDHISQGVAYSVCFNINKVIFVYENRDTCEKRAFLLEVTDEMKYDLIISKIESCDQYVSKLVVPPVPENLQKKICAYCNYKTACRRAGEDGH